MEHRDPVSGADSRSGAPLEAAGHDEALGALRQLLCGPVVKAPQLQESSLAAPSAQSVRGLLPEGASGAGRLISCRRHCLASALLFPDADLPMPQL